MTSHHALVSIHDVMPATLARVEQILQALPPRPVCLLVVPGLDWSADQLDTLHRWQREGHELAGHGWLHHAARIETLYHRAHSLLISRQVAEHLSLDETEIAALIRRNHAWWVDHGFEPPDLYVPPAWAMGRIRPARLRELPFRLYEDTGGVLDGPTGRYARLPLAGFEADRRWRALFLRPWNALNRRLSTPSRPLRLSIHPSDFDYLLADQLTAWLNEISHWRLYRSLIH